MMALQTLTDAALQKTEDIAVYSSDKSTINYLKDRYGDNFNLYGYVIAEVRNDISNLASEDRQRVFYDSWCLKEDALFAEATDKPKDNRIYLTNGSFNGNINAYYGVGLSIPEGTAATLNGNLDFDNGNSVTVDGYFAVKGNFDVINAGMSNPEAMLLVGGNVTIINSYLSRGTVVLNGSETQEIYRLGCNNLIVTNPEGIKYLSEISVTGKFLLNSNPIIDNGYYVFANSQEVLFDSVSDYENVVINSDLVIDYEITGDLTINGRVTVPFNETMIINGDVTFGYGGGLVNEGKIIINGDIRENRFASSSFIENSGDITVLGDVNVINIFMSEENSVFTFGGDLEVTNHYINGGTVILNGTEQQTLCDCDFYNLTVENPNGVKYNGDIGIKGKYLLKGNPLENNGYGTVILSENAYLDSDSDYKNVTVATNWSLSNVITSNLSAYYGVDISIPKGANAGIKGNLNFGNGNGLVVDGDFSVTGDAVVIYAHMRESEATLSVGGNIDFTNSYLSNGTVVLNGAEIQELYGLSCHNLIVSGKKGVEYRSFVNVTGAFLLNGKNLINNGYSTCLNSQNVKLDSVSDYGVIEINSEIQLDYDIIADVRLSGKIIIPEDAKVTINGNITFYYNGALINDGNLTVTGSIPYNPYTSSCYITNNNTIAVNGSIYVNNINMNDENAVLSLGGDFSVSNDYIWNGTLVLNGNAAQVIAAGGGAATIIIDNASAEGVSFSCYIHPSLFDHRGNKFTLMGGGNFADFDGDKVTDEKDDNPTVFSGKNYCETLCDVTGDGETNVLDYISTMKAIVNGNIGDINLDGNADIRDMVYVKKVLLGIYEIVSNVIK